MQKLAADMTPPKAREPQRWTQARVINKTEPRRTEDELRDERARAVQAEMDRLNAIIATQESKRAIGGGNR
ncbi:hypothetical protein [Tabrizicola sp.]|uniref:hypothetical protein n=1 Tax=Tabrizicola sp. TaxID=2005166 RepID=UPI00286AB975|nr:hypothetical protein [Tabrizicola sp.]